MDRSGECIWSIQWSDLTASDRLDLVDVLCFTSTYATGVVPKRETGKTSRPTYLVTPLSFGARTKIKSTRTINTLATLSSRHRGPCPIQAMLEVMSASAEGELGAMPLACRSGFSYGSSMMTGLRVGNEMDCRREGDGLKLKYDHRVGRRRTLVDIGLSLL